jgi:hypothetical protein
MGAPNLFGKLANFEAALRKPGLVLFGLFNPVDNLNFIADLSGPASVATIELTSAALLSLHTSPITLVAAAGAGTLLIPVSYEANYVYGTTAYSNSFSDSAYLTWAGISTSVPLYITGTNNTVAYQNGFTTEGGLTSSSALNQPIVLTTSANPTTGNGVVIVTLVYQVLTGLQ